MDSIITSYGVLETTPSINLEDFQFALNIATAATGIANCTIPSAGFCIISTIATTSQTSAIFLNGRYTIYPIGESYVSTKRFATYALAFRANDGGTYDATAYDGAVYTNVTYIGCNNQDMHVAFIPYAL